MIISTRRCFLFLSVLLIAIGAHADDDNRFVHRVDSTTLAALQQGPNFRAYFSKKIGIVVRTEKPVDALTASSAACNGVLLGRYPTGQGTMDLTLYVRVENGRIETAFPVASVDEAVFAWQNAEKKSVLKDLKPVTDRLSFQEQKGFRWDVKLQRRFAYLLILDVAYEPSAKRLENRSADLVALKKFMAAAESQTHGRRILENNISGLPVFAAVSDRGAAAVFTLHHPMHDIEFNPLEKKWTYAYTGELSYYASFPELKRAIVSPEVKSFLSQSSESVRVTVSGSPKTFFDCSFVRNDGKGVKVRVQGKSVTALMR